MKKGLTELVFVVDRSGSMGGLESDTIGGFNATLEAHRKEEGEAVVSTILFDNEVEVLHDRLPIAEVAPITGKEYWVRGCTALLDAVGGAVSHISRVHGYLSEEARPEHTIVVITTDGMENASREYGYGQVKELISRKEGEGWQFLFLGANIDAAAEAGRIGIPPDFAATYVADGVGTQAMHRAQCAATVAMRAGAPMPAGSWKREIDEDLASRSVGGAGGVGSAGSANGGKLKGNLVSSTSARMLSPVESVPADVHYNGYRGDEAWTGFPG